MPKPTLAFIDHSFHKTTHSSDFLRDLFREIFEVREYWDEAWQGGPSVAPDVINAHDYAFYLQVLNPVAELQKIKIPILWAPMYDGFKFDYAFMKMLEQCNIKILSFSTKVTAWLSQFSIPVMTVQYYYLPPQKVAGHPGNHIFFWYRGGIAFDDIRSILDPKQIDSFTIFERPDKNNKPLSLSGEDVSLYKIKHIQEEFIPRDRYLQFLKEASIFIAPRKKEGIGAFTEALALGKCVIAYDDAVHNEYITNGVDGFLFTERSHPLNLSRARELSEAAFTRAVKGNQRWLSERAQIIPFMLAPYSAKKSSLAIAFWKLFARIADLMHKLRYYKSRLFKLQKN